MSSENKGERAIALIAALQTILDELPQSTDPAGDSAADAEEEEEAPVKDPTHQLFFERLNHSSLASLFASIRIIHHMHRPDAVPP